MGYLLASIRLLIFFVTVILYFVLATPFYPFLKKYPYAIRKILAHIVQKIARFVLFFMAVRVDIKQEEDLKGKEYLLVSNHLSYMDAIVLFAYFPSVFVTSIEVKETPFLGQLCMLAGCLFVERRTKDKLSKEVQDITFALRDGLSVSIFPEATSTSGGEVLRFRRSLYRAAIEAGKPVVPVAINYAYLSGQRVDKSNHDMIFWYGDMTFLDHLWGLFTVFTIEVHIKVGAPMSTEGKDYAQMASESHEWVTANYTPIK